MSWYHILKEIKEVLLGMRLKKMLCFVAVGCLAFSLAACGETKKDQTKQKDQDVIVSKDEKFTFEKVDGGVTITGYDGDVTLLQIPEEVDEQAVVAISDKAFDSEAEITEVIIPDSVKKIGNYAFNYCEKLKKLQLGNGVEEIGEGAFSVCSSLKEVSIPASVKKLGNAGFGSNVDLKKVTMEASVETIPNALFCDTNLQKFTVPDGVKTISESAFSICPKLKELFIPESVTEIHETALEGSPNVIIIGKTGSYAETFAKENSIPFKACPKCDKEEK